MQQNEQVIKLLMNSQLYLKELSEILYGEFSRVDKNLEQTIKEIKEVLENNSQ